MKAWLILLTAWAGTAGAVALPDLADVQWDGRRIVASPGEMPAVSETSITILKSEQCGHRVESRTAIEVPGTCRYLSGIFRYRYQPTGDNPAHRVAVGFALERGGSDGHALIVSMPLDLPEASLSR